MFDPIDGTTNYAHGLPIFCASLALELDGVAEVGAIYDPNRKELFTAERGGGAFLNGRPLRVSTTATLVDAMLVTGFPYDVHDRVDEIVGLFGAFVGEARAVRRLGSAAIDLCYVAAGRMDGFWERDLKPWDVAAGRADRRRSRRSRDPDGRFLLQLARQSGARHQRLDPRPHARCHPAETSLFLSGRRHRHFGQPDRKAHSS